VNMVLSPLSSTMRCCATRSDYNDPGRVKVKGFTEVQRNCEPDPKS
jgi:hypothetical protein